MVRVGVDIGGSGVRTALVGDDGRVGDVHREELAGRDVDDVVRAVARGVARVGGVEGVGVGMPGFVHDGVVLSSPNFPSWRDVPLQARLTEAVGAQVVVENDANAAALGAVVARSGRGVWLVLTLGTGVGGGVVADGKPWRGGAVTGAELGHIFAGGTRPCACGGLGCLEAWCGTVGLVAAARERGQDAANGAAVVTAAREGSEWALAVLHEASVALGRGLVSLVNAFGPDRVLVLGGLAAAADLLRPAAVAYVRERAVMPLRGVPVEFGSRADELAIVGAASLLR
jgi:glucokinase